MKHPEYKRQSLGDVHRTHCEKQKSEKQKMPTEEASPRTLMVIVCIIGLIFAIVMVILFFNAAPARSNIEVHRQSAEDAACLKCHLKGDEKSPTMPHLDLGNCNLCHGLSKEPPR